MKSITQGPRARSVSAKLTRFGDESCRVITAKRTDEHAAQLKAHLDRLAHNLGKARQANDLHKVKVLTDLIERAKGQFVHYSLAFYEGRTYMER